MCLADFWQVREKSYRAITRFKFAYWEISMADSHTQDSQTIYISMQGISKRFPGVLANDNVDLDIYNAEIHALLGENGAGKSTLMKILYGYYRADEGRILYQGKPYSTSSPLDARAIQIGMVFQDLNLIPAMSVAENIALFLPDLPAILKTKEIAARITEISKRYNLEVEPDALVSQLSIGEQQKVEILKLLLSDARLLILDEPTRVLAPHEVDALFSVLNRLREDGYAIVLITHKLKEVLACSDRITVLRKGHVAGSLLRSEADENKLVELMFAKRISTLQVAHKPERGQTSEPLLELRAAGTRGEGAETSLKDIDLKIYPGELVGVAGVSGNGQKELGDLVLGMTNCTSGVKLLEGQDMTNMSINDTRKSGVVFVPENPLAMASVPFMTVLENFSLTNTWRYARQAGMNIDWPAVEADARNSLENLGFDVPLYAPAKTLSGGNLQRMVIAREMCHQPRLIVASYLTRGLDVQSTLAARKALLQAREEGAGVLLISEDLEELFLLSDRLIVLYQGEIVGTFAPTETDIYEIGHLMTGSEVHYATQG
jgi:simple sugar transport system ATP-binding protein